MPEDGDGFLGHIVIDHTQYALIDSNGHHDIKDLPGIAPGTDDPLRLPKVGQPLAEILGTDIQGPDDVAAAAVKIAAQRDRSLVQLLFVNARLKATALGEVGVTDFMDRSKFAEYLREAALDQGANGVIAYYEGGENIFQEARSLISAGVLTDALVPHPGGGLPATVKPTTWLGTSDVSDRWVGKMVTPKDAVELREDQAKYDAQEQVTTPALTITFANSPQLKGGMPMKLGGMQHVRPVEFPELVRLAKELMGKTPTLKRFRKAAGMFYGGPGKAMAIRLHPELFKNSMDAAKVLAHEIGHATDFLPDYTLKRGNIIGRLYTLRQFLKDKFGTESNREIRAELIKVTQYWHPYDPANVPESYVKYRESAVELYADSLSVLFNSPGLLEKMAPKFYSRFWQELDRKPQVKQALFDLQDFLSHGKVSTLARRQQDIETMFTKGDEILKRKAAEREARRRSWEGYWLELKQHLFDGYEPIVAKDPALRAALDESLMGSNVNHRFTRRVFEGVVKPVEDMGMTVDHIGQVLFLERVMAGRKDIANPLGITPEVARDQMLKLRLDLGINRMTILKGAIAKFHDLVYPVTEEAVKVGAYNEEVHQRIIAPNRDTYAAFAVLDYLEDHIPASIRRQIGTLKEVANPFTATVLKTIALNNLITLQRAKNSVRDNFLSQFPGEFEKAPVAFGKDRPPAKADRGVLMILENGRQAFYYCDPLIAHAFERSGPHGLERVTRILDFVYRRFMYPLQISYNVSFQFFTNPVRDFMRTWRNLPPEAGRWQFMKLMRSYYDVYGEAVKRCTGQTSGLNEEMMANFAIAPPYEVLGKALRDDVMADILAKYRLLPKHEDSGWLNSMLDARVFKPVRELGDWIKFRGMVHEALPKMASYRLFTRQMGMAPREAAGVVRNYMGTPNIHRRGKSVQVVRAFVPFFNIYAQGWRMDWQRMSQAKTRSGWWFKWAMTDGGAAILAGLATAGVLGVALKQLFGAASEYDKSNYNIIPVGWVPGGDFGRRVAYIRIARAEDSRLISGIAYKLTQWLAGHRPHTVTEVLDFGAGQFPSVNPAVQVPEKWLELAQGQNPADPFRGRPIIPRERFEAGGANTLAPMFSWTMDQTGASSFINWDRNAMTTQELTISAIPGINRLLKISDYGYREEQNAVVQNREQDLARHRVAYPDNVQSLLAEYSHLSSLKEENRTQAQADRFRDLTVWHNQIYRPYDEQIRQAEQDGRNAEAARDRVEIGNESRQFQRVPR